MDSATPTSNASANGMSQEKMGSNQVSPVSPSDASSKATASNNSQSLAKTSPTCPLCSRDDRVSNYESFETYFYSRVPDERRDEFPHMLGYNSHYFCEADYCNYDVWFHHAVDDANRLHYVGKRTKFCYFRPEKDNNIVYVCYYGH